MLRLGLIDSIMRNLFGASFTLLLTLILFMNYHVKSCSFASDRTHHLEMLFLLSIPPILLLKQCHLPAIWIIIQLTQVYLLNQLPRRGLILQLAQFQYRAGAASVVWLLSVYVSCSSHYHWTHNAGITQWSHRTWPCLYEHWQILELVWHVFVVHFFQITVPILYRLLTLLNKFSFLAHFLKLSLGKHFSFLIRWIHRLNTSRRLVVRLFFL